jgi:hypothetical protein
MSSISKYINSQSFLTATSVYDDVNLLTPSADGYYQFGGNYREQLLGVLGPVVICPSCSPAAGLTAFPSSSFNATILAACADVIDFTFYHTGANPWPIVNDTIYLNNVITPANLIGARIFKANNTAYETNSSSVVTTITAC